jgi:hypothetical protein
VDELAQVLTKIQAARTRRDLDYYVFRRGEMHGMLTRHGYRLQAAPVPIDPADRWRVALAAELDLQ